jgi:hypothetical protein
MSSVVAAEVHLDEAELENGFSAEDIFQSDECEFNQNFK